MTDDVGNQDQLDLLIPDGHTEIIFNYGSAYNRFSLHENRAEKVSKSCFIGQRKKSILANRSPDSKLIGIKLQPGAIYQLLGIPERNFAHQTIYLTDLPSQEWTNLEEQLILLPDRVQQIARLDQFFKEKMISRQDRHPDLISAILRHVRQNQRVSLPEIHQKFGTHPKKLERLFQEHVGLSPKTYLKINRFKEVYKMFNRVNKPFYDQSFYDLGYYDQMHFIKEFRFFIGQTPTAYYNSETNIADDILTSTIRQLAV